MSAKLRSMGRGTFVGALACCLWAQPAAWADEPAAAQGSTATPQVASEETASDSAAGPAAKRRQPAAGIEEITVTARKREENLQETPIAISAFGAEDIKDLEVRRINDIQASVPNLQFDQAVGQANAARISIRGVGNGDSIISDDPGVGVYIDGVFLPRAQGALLSVSDIARIEVLRGPQGTLFGKNTIGGAVNIITQKPTYDFSGSAQLRVGNFDQLETKFVLNVPLVPERVSTRFSFTSKQRDGFTKNRFVGGGSRTNDDKLLAGRAQLLINASDSLELLFSGDMSYEPRAALTGKCKFIGPRPTGSRVETPEIGAVQLTQAALTGAGLPADAFEKACREEDARNDFKTRQDGRLDDEITSYGMNATATWSPSSAFTFKSTSSYRGNENRSFGDADLTILPLAQDGRRDHDEITQEAISQEFNFSGVAIDDRFKWTMGLYGFVEKNKDFDRGQTLPITDRGPANIPSAGTLFNGDRDPGFDLPAGQQFPELNGSGNCVAAADQGNLLQSAFGRLAASNPALFARNPDGSLRITTGANGVANLSAATPSSLRCIRRFVGLRTTGTLKANTTSYAAYSQGTFDVTDAFSVTAGLRFTHERKRIARFRRFTDPRASTPGILNDDVLAAGGVDRNFEQSERFDKFTPMLNLQYRFNDEANAYFTYSRGFKSGGFNGRATEIETSRTIDPEVLTSYEVGFKSRWFENRLIANVAAFTNVYRDIQLTVVGTDDQGALQLTVDNAGKAAINGAEFEFVGLPLPGLELSTSIGVTAARYVEFNRPGFGNVKLPNTPTYTMTFGAAYTLPVGTWGDLRTRVGWRHTGEKSSDVSDPHFNRVPKHGVMSGRLAFEFSDGKTELALFGDNLLDRRYFANAVDSTSTTLRYYAPPRTYGLELTREF